MSDTDIRDAFLESPMSRTVIVEGHRFEIEIFKYNDSGWVLQITAPTGRSFVNDEFFPTEADALGAALADFENTPVESYLEPEPGPSPIERIQSAIAENKTSDGDFECE